MATLIDFTTAFTGGPSFYTGSGVSALVPDVFPVAISGHPYMIDMRSNQFARAFENRLRESADDSNIPGEGTLNPQGLWRRGQVSWHKGSGQKYGDTATGVDTRFYTSKGVNPWVKGELSLLKNTNTVSAHTGSNTDNIFMAVADSTLFWSVNQSIKYSSNPHAASPTISTVASTPAAKIRALASDGTNVYATFPGTSSSYGLWKVVASTGVASNVANGHEFGPVAYVKGRWMVGGAGSDAYRIWQNPSGTNPTVFYGHSNTSWTWVGFASGQNAIYAAGYAGRVSLIYKITIKSDGTLDTPVVAAELPVGELVYSIHGYLGYVLIGTDRGVRMATTDDNSNLLVGPVLETSNPVKCFTSDGRFVWYGWSNFDASSTGVGRLDLSELNSPNEPAYASDLMTTAQGTVTGVAAFDERILFAVDGAGVFGEDDADLVASGYIETGYWRWGIPDRKFAAFCDFRSNPLNGELTMALDLDGAGYESIAPFSNTGGTEKTFDGPDTGFGEALIKVTFTRSATASVGPKLTRWQVRAFPAPTQSELFSVPVLLHRKINRFGRDYFVDVVSELAYLRDLVKDRRIVSYQEGNEQFRVIVENVQWIPIDSGQKPYEYDGTAVVTIRSLAA